MDKKTCLLILFSLLALVSCHKKHDDIDLNKVDVKIQIQRFEQDLFNQHSDSLNLAIPILHKKYGNFYTLFGEKLIGIGGIEDPRYPGFLAQFITNQTVLESFQKVNEVFPTLDNLNDQLTSAFKRYRYYFPQKNIPSVYSFVSGFNQSIVIADSILAIGLERYLGRDCEYYVSLDIPKYLSHNMYPQKIPSDCMNSWAIGEFPFNDSIDNLANNMIYEGMLMYFTHTMLPDEPDSLIFGFTPKQMEWCIDNEKEIWLHLIENKLLFTTDSFTINKLVNFAPFTSGFTQESPGRAVVWVGYRIIQAYLKNNPEVTLPMLMNLEDYQQILNKSKYKP